MTIAPDGCVVAVDIGSSGVRAVAYRTDYQPVASASRAVAINNGADGRSTQSWDRVRNAFAEAVAEVASAPFLTVEALVCSGTASCLAVADRGSGQVLDDEIVLWSDARAVPYQRLAAMDAASAYDLTLCPPHASYWPAKLRWLADKGLSEDPSVILAGAKDLLFHGLTGQFWTDPMTAASTGIFDSLGWKWEEGLVAASGGSVIQLPELQAATAWAPARAGLATAAGLAEGTPVVLGGMDGPLAQLGAAGWSADIGSCTVGTSIASRRSSPERRPDESRRLWCYPISPSRWVSGGAGSNGGNVVTWLADLFGPGIAIGTLIADALAGPPDPDLLFVPYLNGERSPLWREDLRGGVLGLGPRHTKNDIARAALEAVGLAAAELASAIVDDTGPPDRFALTGGFVHDHEWAQLVTDALGTRTFVPAPDGATCTGAAVIGWSALGEELEQAQLPVTETQLRSPDGPASAALGAKAAWLREVRDFTVAPARPAKERG